MLPNDRAQPAAPDKPTLGGRAMDVYRRLPIWLKVLTVIAAIFLSGPIILAAMVYGVVAVAPSGTGWSSWTGPGSATPARPGWPRRPPGRR